MDQIKIGKFIAERRRTLGLTQMDLSERLGITDRAVSKWENGRSMPDSSIMLPLCRELKISVNDLLSGEITDMSNINQQLEEKLLEFVKEKERADKRLLTLEILIATLSCIVLFALIFVVAFADIDAWIAAVIFILGFIPFFIGMTYALRIEQVAGYYECLKCHHKYVPTFKSVFWAMHICRTRYMRCPNCKKKSWHRKTVTKD